jgi:drug/metabolite transporter (DMT)-like permease
LGVTLIVFASLSVSLGTYLLSSVFQPAPAIIKYASVFQSKYLLFLIGLSLNLTGSVFWFLARRFLTSYAFAWSLYLGLLVAFGTLIAVIIENERLIAPQFAGLLLLFISLLLLKK